jgi:predicted ATPase
MFSEIELHRWRQFNNVYIKFDKRMTVLTGENGTGKTTILNILSRHFGWNLNFISTLLPLSKKRRNLIWSDIWDAYMSNFDVPPGSTEVGTIKYEDGRVCKLMVEPRTDKAQYTPKYTDQQSVLGLHIPSHQPAFTYHRITNIPTDPQSSQQIYQAYNGMLQEYFTVERARNPGTALKQSLISLAVFGYGNQAVVENPEYIRMFEEFERVLRILLPKVLGFQKLEIRMPDIVLVTQTGDFSLDAASGGIGAIVGIAWQIFMYGQNNKDFVVTIDEPESHLHPSMQRELLPNLFQAFPHTQFIIATHSPFIVTSSSEARVYALVFDENRRVNSQYLETAELSGTANETLREILGVPITVPIWVEKRLLEILERYKDRELSADLLKELKKELVTNNLGFLLPDALTSLGGGGASST